VRAFPTVVSSPARQTPQMRHNRSRRASPNPREDAGQPSEMPFADADTAADTKSTATRRHP
jgi:hypothetical protein